MTTRTPPDRRTVITGITDRLTHPSAPDDDYGPRSRRWWAQSIAHGAAGVAILHACLDRTGENRQLIHRWLAAAVTEELSAAPGAGAWFGAPAVAFAFAHSAPDGTYRGARVELDRALEDIARDRLDKARRRIRARKRPRIQEFDLVNGLAGIGGYLLQRDPSDAHRLVAQVLSYFVALTEPVDAADAVGTTVPGWWTADPPPGCPTARGGHSDQGAAHGICGTLSLLALAGRAGIWVPGQHQAMQRIGDWYDGLARTDNTGCWWPQRACTSPPSPSPATTTTAPTRLCSGQCQPTGAKAAATRWARPMPVGDRVRIPSVIVGPGLDGGLGTSTRAWPGAARRRGPDTPRRHSRGR